MSLIDENYTSNIDLVEMENADFQGFQSKLTSVFQSVSNVLDGIFVTKTQSKSVDLQNCNVDLKTLVEQNSRYKQEITSKSEELSMKQSQYENLKKDRKILSQEIKDTHEALLMAKKYYKKFLKFYYTIEKSTETKQIIYLQFFTESRKEGDKYSIRLHRDLKTSQYTLEQMNPQLKSFKELQHQLQETNDVPSILCSIRQSFIKHKTR